VAEPKSPPLTPQQERFVEEYLIDLNATAAYRRAFPEAAAESARTLAARLLAKVRVRRAVARGKARLRRRFGDAQERAVRELLRLAFSDIGDVVDLTDRDHPRLKPHADIPPDARRAVQEIGRTRHGVRVRMADKLAALDKVFRHLGLFRDLPPLEVLLGALPPAVAEAVRAALAAQVHGGGDPAGGGAALPPAGPGPGPGGGVALGGPGGPDAGGGVGAGPVAGGVPGERPPAAGAALLPPGGQERGERGEDLDALFGRG